MPLPGGSLTGNLTQPPDPEDVRKTNARNATRAYRQQIRQLKQVVGRQNRVPALAELIDNIIAEMGGAEAVAQEFKKVYKSSDTNAATKARMLERIIELVKMHAEFFGQGDDFEDVSEADIMAFIDSEMGDVFKEEEETGGAADGQPEGPVEPAGEIEAAEGHAVDARAGGRSGESPGGDAAEG